MDSASTADATASASPSVVASSTTSTITTIASTNNNQLLGQSAAKDVDADEREIEQYIDDLIKQNPTDMEEEEEKVVLKQVTAQVTVSPMTNGDEPESLFEEAERGAESLHVDPAPIVQRHTQTATIQLEDWEPIYEVIEEISEPKPLKSALKKQSKKKERQSQPKPEVVMPPALDDVPQQAAEAGAKPLAEVEPYYQVPKSSEPYYNVPKPNPIPLYENVDIFLSSVNEQNKGELLSPIPAGVILKPPTMKPPPPPVMSEPEESDEDEAEAEEGDETGVVTDLNETPEENFKRKNSTKRIKKEIRNKRSSFLGIEGGNDDDYELKLSVAPPPDMTALIQEERRLEKQFLKNGLYDCSGEFNLHR